MVLSGTRSACSGTYGDETGMRPVPSQTSLQLEHACRLESLPADAHDQFLENIRGGFAETNSQGSESYEDSAFLQLVGRHKLLSLFFGHLPDRAMSDHRKEPSSGCAS